MPVATSAASSATNSSTQQMMHQSQSGSAMLSTSGIPPRGNKKCPPSPTPNFNARSLPKGKSYYIFFWIIIPVSILSRI